MPLFLVFATLCRTMRFIPFLVAISTACSDANDGGSFGGNTGADAGGADGGGELRVNSPGTEALLEQMKTEDAEHYQDAIDAGVQFFPTSDKASFYAFWTPADFDPATDGFVMTLTGHGSFVSAGFAAWQPFLEERNYGFLALEWWLGQGEALEDYYLPFEIYPAFEEAIAEQEIPRGRILFEGFSRGSTNTYALTAMDNASQTPLFLLSIANAGGEIDDFPPTAEINDGKYGDEPFSGTDWVLFCGGQDPEPDRDGCPAMSATKTWIEGYGGTVDLFIQDEAAGHGGFHQNADNANQALDVYDSLRASALD